MIVKTGMRSFLLIGIVSLYFCADLYADVLKLKDGNVLNGKYHGGTVSVIKFELGGIIQEFPVDKVESVSFEGAAAAKTSSAAQTTVATTSQTSGIVTVAAGTRMMIRTTGPIGTKTHKKGSRFDGVLDVDLAANGVVVAPKGSKVYGQVVDARGGKRLGKAYLHLTFTDISINNQLVPIITDQIGVEGGRGGTIRMVGAGALIGAAAGDAGKGAMVAGGLRLLGPGNHIAIPVGTIGEVRLKQPLTVQK